MSTLGVESRGGDLQTLICAAIADTSAVVSASGALAGAAIGAIFAWVGVRHTSRVNQRIAEGHVQQASASAVQGFERELLISLQDALTRLMDASARFHDEEVRAMSKGAPKYGAAHADKRWSNDAFLAGIEVNKLRVRVHDDELRLSVADTQKHCATVTFAATREESWASLEAAAERFEYANELIGTRIRGLQSLQSRETV